MRYSVLVLVGTFALSACSMFQRSHDPDPALLPPGTALHVPDEDSEAETADKAQPGLEDEVAKLNTKIEALETKLAVLTHAFENFQATKSQPQINADQGSAPDQNAAQTSDTENSSQPSLSVPVVEQPREAHVKNVSAAPVPPARGSNAVEGEFRKAMTEFQQGHYRNAAQQFAALAQENPNHLLAGHALYWAGEANARVQQWSGAIEDWENIEKNYPTSTYVPEALAGLAKAYEVQGNVSKAKGYKETLTRSFPNSPVALAVASSSTSDMNQSDRTVNKDPADNAPAAAPTDDGQSENPENGEE